MQKSEINISQVQSNVGLSKRGGSLMVGGIMLPPPEISYAVYGALINKKIINRIGRDIVRASAAFGAYALGNAYGIAVAVGGGTVLPEAASDVYDAYLNWVKKGMEKNPQMKVYLDHWKQKSSQEKLASYSDTLQKVNDTAGEDRVLYVAVGNSILLDTLIENEHASASELRKPFLHWYDDILQLNQVTQQQLAENQEFLSMYGIKIDSLDKIQKSIQAQLNVAIKQYKQQAAVRERAKQVATGRAFFGIVSAIASAFGNEDLTMAADFAKDLLGICVEGALGGVGLASVHPACLMVGATARLIANRRNRNRSQENPFKLIFERFKKLKENLKRNFTKVYGNQKAIYEKVEEIFNYITSDVKPELGEIKNKVGRVQQAIAKFARQSSLDRLDCINNAIDFALDGDELSENDMLELKNLYQWCIRSTSTCCSPTLNGQDAWENYGNPDNADYEWVKVLLDKNPGMQIQHLLAFMENYAAAYSSKSSQVAAKELANVEVWSFAVRKLLKVFKIFPDVKNIFKSNHIKKIIAVGENIKAFIAYVQHNPELMRNLYTHYRGMARKIAGEINRKLDHARLGNNKQQWINKTVGEVIGDNHGLEQIFNELDSYHGLLAKFSLLVGLNAYTQFLLLNLPTSHLIKAQACPSFSYSNQMVNIPRELNNQNNAVYTTKSHVLNVNGEEKVYLIMAGANNGRHKVDIQLLCYQPGSKSANPLKAISTDTNPLQQIKGWVIDHSGKKGIKSVVMPINGQDHLIVLDYDDRNHCLLTHAYNPVTNKWHELQKYSNQNTLRMRMMTLEAQVLYVDGKPQLYLLASHSNHDGTKFTNSTFFKLHHYDPSSKQWSSKISDVVKGGRTDAQYGVFGKILMVLNHHAKTLSTQILHFNGHDHFAFIYRYVQGICFNIFDPVKGTWLVNVGQLGDYAKYGDGSDVYTQERHYETIRTATFVQGDETCFYFLIRAQNGFVHYAYTPSSRTWHELRQDAFFQSWNDQNRVCASKSFYRTIQLESVEIDDRQLMVIGVRDSSGLHIRFFDPLNNQWLSNNKLNIDYFADRRNVPWSANRYFESISLGQARIDQNNTALLTFAVEKEQVTCQEFPIGNLHLDLKTDQVTDLIEYMSQQNTKGESLDQSILAMQVEELLEEIDEVFPQVRGPKHRSEKSPTAKLLAQRHPACSDKAKEDKKVEENSKEDKGCILQ